MVHPNRRERILDFVGQLARQDGNFLRIGDAFFLLFVGREFGVFHELILSNDAFFQHERNVRIELYELCRLCLTTGRKPRIFALFRGFCNNGRRRLVQRFWRIPCFHSKRRPANALLAD